jgi:arylsulfatase A-like enzyme
MRQWIIALGFVAAFSIASRSTVAAPPAPAKPNVIVFLCDDTGYGEFGFQGNTEIPTPNIDSIARNGVRFTAGYVSGPYCSPTRAGLLTGRYQTRFGHEFNGGGPAGGEEFGLPLSEKTIADRLKALGYATNAVGKWHLGGPPKYLPTKRGFDEFYGTVANSPFFKPPHFVDSRVSPEEVRAVTDEDFYTTDAYAQRAVDWMGKQEGKPYFLYLPFNAQHAPLQATKKYLDRFPNISDEKRRTFAAMMSAMDDAVGRVLEQVRAMKAEENTLIFFLADNGGPTASTTSTNGPLRGFKSTTNEGGVRVPFCAQWKGQIPAGAVYEKPIIQLDILPTAIIAAGGTIDPAWKLDGVDLMPHLKANDTATPAAAAPHEMLYWRFGEQWAIRKGDWKLVASRIDQNQPRLINLATDIAEANDLSSQQPDKLKELKADYEAWNKEQTERLWKPAPAKKKRQAGRRGAAATQSNVK